MARRVTDGGEGETGLVGGGSGVGTITYETTDAYLRRGKAYIFAMAGSQSSKDLGTGLTNVALRVPSYVRFMMRWPRLPSRTLTILRVFTGSTALTCQITSTGSLGIYNSAGTQIGSGSSNISRDTWYRVEVGWTIDRTTNGYAELLIDGVQVAVSNTADLGTTTGRPIIGNPTGHTDTGVVVWMDDIAYNDGSGTDQISWPGEGKVLLARPTGDSSVGTGWEKPGGGTTDLWRALVNVPPTGIADTTDSRNADRQIRNATSTATGDYDFRVQDYTTLGLNASDRVTLVTPYAATGSDNATDTAGAMRCVSNPAAGAETSFAAFDNGVAGTHPTNWRGVGAGTVYDPRPTFGTEPVIRLGKRTATTRVALAEQAGLIVEFVPVTATTLPLDVGGAVASGNAFGVSSALSVGAAVANGVAFAISSLLARGEAVANGLTTTSVTSLITGDAAAAGNNPTALNPVSAGGALADGLSTRSSTTLTTGEAIAAGTILTALVETINGGATATGNAVIPASALGIGSAIADGIPVTVASPLQVGAALADGMIPVAVNILPIGGATAGGNDVIIISQPDVDRLPTSVIFVDNTTFAALQNHEAVVGIVDNSSTARLNEYRTFTSLNYG